MPLIFMPFNLKKLITVSVFAILTVDFFAFERLPTQELFYSYLKNDSDLKKLTIEAEKAGLSLKSTEISKGFNLTLSTGTVSVKTTGQSGQISVKSAGISASLPQASNLTASVSTDLNFSDEASTKNNSSASSSNNPLSDLKLNLELDIISNSSLNQKIELMKAERSFTEAKRNLQNEALQSETDFYTSLKSLLNSTSEIITAQTNLYTDTIDFEATKAKGYSPNSSTYKLAQMKVISDQHDIESKKRTLIHDYTIFYKECGYEISLDEKTDFYDLIPSDIPSPEILKIEDFAPENYTKTESAQWTYKINTLTRQSNRNFTLTANGGYTFNNSTTGSNTVDTGLSSTIGGVNLSAGISFPLEASPNPAYTFSASLSPNQFRQNKITNQTNKLSQEEEELAILEAQKDYETVVVDKEQELLDLEWNKKTYQENYQMYQELAEELKIWFDQGIIKESEYLSALSNAKNYKVKLVTNSIDFIIYNNEVQTLFVGE